MDYINREAAIEAVRGRFSMPVDNLIAEVILAIPAADVREVVRAEWVFKWDAKKDPKKLFTRIVCSECRLHTGQVSNFCPNCGAMMGGQDNA